ncbi:MAG: calcium-binding protein [Chloroflexota bacterium]
MYRSSILRYTVLFLSVFIFMVSKPIFALTIDIHRVSVSSTGEQANEASGVATLSADGRYIVFDSLASNLVADDTNGVYDVFVHDIQTATTTRVSVSSTGQEANATSGSHAISADGRYIVFGSNASNLVANDTNGVSDYFLRDMQTGTITRITLSSVGVEANSFSDDVSISGDGRYIAFSSRASNLVPNDTNDEQDVFVHDMQTGMTTREDVTSTGQQTASGGNRPVISQDGRYIAFIAGDLIPSDTNGLDDIYVRDLQTGINQVATLSSTGDSIDIGTANYPSISAHGRFVAFFSDATNLVPDDTNGQPDVFVRDMQADTTTRVNVSTQGAQTNYGWSWSYPSALSSDGRFVTFQAGADNLVPNDTNGLFDVFVHDMQTGITARMSLGYNGAQAHGEIAALSPDGRFVGFQSPIANLVPNDTNNNLDVFVTVNTLFPVTTANASPIINYYAQMPFTLTWNSVSWATGYEVEIATTRDFGASVISSFTTAADELQTAVSSIRNGHFYWRVRAQNAAGTPATWGTIYSFDVNSS